MTAWHTDVSWVAATAGAAVTISGEVADLDAAALDLPTGSLPVAWDTRFAGQRVVDVVAVRETVTRHAEGVVS